MGEQSGYDCPGCRAPMRRQMFARRPEGEVALDICFGCQAIWFDAFESSQLTPGATIELFRAINERPATPAPPITDAAAVQTLRRAVINAKHGLSFVPAVTVSFDWDGKQYRRE